MRQDPSTLATPDTDSPDKDSMKTVEQLYGEGKAAFDRKDFDKAIWFYEKAVSLDGLQPGTGGLTLEIATNARRALATVHLVTQHFQRATHHYDLLLSGDSPIWQDRFNRAYCLFQLTLFQEAAEDFSCLIQHNDPKVRGMSYEYRARCYRRLEKLELSLHDCNAYLELCPDNIAGLNNRGVVYFRKKDYPQALEDYNQALKLDERFVLAWSNRGSWYLETQQYEKAEQDLLTAIRLEPRFGTAHFIYGQVLLKKGEVALGYAHLRRGYFLGFKHIHCCLDLFRAMPFLQRDVLGQYSTLEEIRQHFRILTDLQRECASWDLYLRSLKLAGEVEGQPAWTSLQAIVQYYMGNAMACLHIYRSGIKAGFVPDLRDWYYLLNAALAFLEEDIEKEAILAEIARSANRDMLSRYYAAQLCRLLQKPEQALGWLLRARGFAPADQVRALLTGPKEEDGQPQASMLKGEITPILITSDTTFTGFMTQLTSRLPAYELAEEQMTDDPAVFIEPRHFPRLLQFHPSFLEKDQLNAIYHGYQQIEQAFVHQLQERIDYADPKDIRAAVIRNADAIRFRDEVNARWKDPDWPGNYPPEYAVAKQIGLQTLDQQETQNMILYFALEGRLTARQSFRLLLYAIKIDRLLLDEQSLRPAEKEVLDQFIRYFWLKLPAGLLVKIVGSALKAARLLPQLAQTRDDYLDYQTFEENFYGYFGLFLGELQKRFGE
jgi:tetratricopeptide (TPR) repeat protein